MADIDLTRSHSLGIDGGREAVERVAHELEQNLGVRYEWDDDTLQFDGQGADGRIEVDDDTIRVVINLSVYLQPIKNQVEAEAKQFLSEHLSV